jgi:transposase
LTLSRQTSGSPALWLFGRLRIVSPLGMRPRGRAQELERRRRRAVQAVKEGDAVADVARVLGVSERALYGWLAAERARGERGLEAKPHPGPKPRLNRNQERQVLSWLKKPPSAFGFPTELWTAPRVARLIKERLGVGYHPRYVNEWLTKRGITPQKPATQPRERNARRIAAWRSRTGPRLKRGRPRPGRTSS